MLIYVNYLLFDTMKLKSWPLKILLPLKTTPFIIIDSDSYKYISNGFSLIDNLSKQI